MEFDCEKDLNDINRFIATAPVTFQVGDIVEAQVSFAVVPLREGKMKTSMILRSITLLDGTQTQASSFKGNSGNTTYRT